MIGDGAEPVEIGKHRLGLGHGGLDAGGDVEHLRRAGLERQAARHPLDHLVARIGNGIDRMAEADHHLLGLDTATDIRLRLGGIGVALLDLEGHLVGAAVLWTAQCTDRAGDGGIEVRSGAGDRTGGEGRGVELMLGIEDQRGVHGAHMRRLRRRAVQHVQEMAADGSVVGLDVDPPAVLGEVMPVEQHGTEGGHQSVGDIAGAGMVVIDRFRQHASERRDA